MLFWLLAALLTLIVTAAIVLPLLRRTPDGAQADTREAYDREVFRAQLRELAGDVERGAIAPADAAGARAEIGRRLLRAETAAAKPAIASRRPVLAALVVALLLPLGAFVFYDRTGTPEIGDQPLASRDLEAKRPSVAAIVGLIEQRLADRPDDAEGWSVVAPVYLRMGEGAKAANAYRNVIRLSGETPQNQAGLGEAMVQAAGGEVSPEAQATFRRALELQPGLPAARFYLALALSQSGQNAEAAVAWDALLADAPADAPFRPVAEAALADARAASSAPSSGPTAADVEAAASLSTQDSGAMIEGMVAQLASRLESTPDDPDGWARLMRSYVVLGQRERAGAALRRALDVFPQGSPGRMTVAEAASALGLDASGPVSTP
ncbi:c-type cytochrome biogenesis protein CcmI [Aureimonas sp. AU4]|uniref:c-type cytochrome biogenesis protein CcmI n=1 Tax=Aureimonas sp. AU4 TaxID=1638163 RepID=UPI0007813635|nr:c-type cytochrome biogenesis protein CcmI [Aureimonas sp. AU4]